MLLNINKNKYFYIATIIFLFCCQNILFASNHLKNIRVINSYDNSRIVLDLSENPDYTSFTLDNPNRIVLDIANTKIKDKKIFSNIKWDNSDIVKLRYSNYKNKLRLVFDLNNTSLKNKYKLFYLSPNGNIYGHRLVIDVKNSNKMVKTELDAKLVAADQKLPTKFTVIIDPGHGGTDPGALGARGTREKDVVLKVAKYLKQYIDQDQDMQAELTRDSDYYVGLRGRTELARTKQADLFVSIHADGFRDSRAKGSSVYVLSERGASSELAKWIADHENSVDLVGGVSLDNKDVMLATVLLDLSQTASNRSSVLAANSILSQMSQVTELHKSHIEKAGFMVLKSPDIPSVLVETGFISNPKGERKLRSSSHQRMLAYAIYKGIKDYFKTQPKPNYWPGEIYQAKR